MRRALNLFQNKEKYEICRKNAFNSAIDVADVGRAWCREFYRLKNKIYFDVKKAKNLDLDKEIEKEEKEINLSNNIKKEKESKKETEKERNIGEKLVTFSYKFNNNRHPKTVLVSGSFDNLNIKYPLKYDNREKKWICKLKIKNGKYSYKYIIDGNWEINPDENQIRDRNGNVNNLINV